MVKAEADSKRNQASEDPEAPRRISSADRAALEAAKAIEADQRVAAAERAAAAAPPECRDGSVKINLPLPPPPPDSHRQTNSHKAAAATTSSKVLGGAAVAGGVVGLALVGPLAGLVAAGAAAYAATRSDEVGQVAQATGKATVAIGDKAAALDREHHISEKAKKAAADAAKAAQDFNEKHDVTGKALRGMTVGMNWTTEKAGGSSSK
jgi:hypothetical protein